MASMPTAQPIAFGPETPTAGAPADSPTACAPAEPPMAYAPAHLPMAYAPAASDLPTAYAPAASPTAYVPAESPGETTGEVNNDEGRVDLQGRPPNNERGSIANGQRAGGPIHSLRA